MIIAYGVCMNTIEISIDHERMQFEAILAFLRESYWSPNIRPEVLRNAIDHSLVVGAFDQVTSQQVGFARVVTDTATFAWICDVFVATAYRKQKIATRMIQALFTHPQIKSLRRWCLATRDAHPLYVSLGFKPVVEGRWLELKLNDADWWGHNDPAHPSSLATPQH
jgi:GNAT superfamily N-acetyltransferase